MHTWIQKHVITSFLTHCNLCVCYLSQQQFIIELPLVTEAEHELTPDSVFTVFHNAIQLCVDVLVCVCGGGAGSHCS